MPESIETVTVSDLVRRASALVDPDGADDIVRELLIAYEDDDRAAAGLGDGVREEMRGTVEGLDPESTSGAAAVAAATASFLATQPEGGTDGDATIREAARLEWHGTPPDHVAAWLRDHGIED